MCVTKVKSEPTCLILAVVSAYGTMGVPENRYRTVIKGTDKEEISAGLNQYLKSEIKRALNDEEIMNILEKPDMESVLEKVDLSSLSVCDGGLDIVSVMDLLTDYHIEYSVYDKASPLADADEFIVMSDNGGSNEFASVVQIFDVKTDKLEGEECAVCYNNDVANGTLRGTPSELAEELLGWERHIVKSFDCRVSDTAPE